MRVTKYKLFKKIKVRPSFFDFLDHKNYFLKKIESVGRAKKIICCRKVGSVGHRYKNSQDSTNCCIDVSVCTKS